MPTYTLPAYSVSLNAFKTAQDFAALGATLAVEDATAVQITDDDGILDLGRPQASSVSVNEDAQGALSGIETFRLTREVNGTAQSFDMAAIFRAGVADVLLVPFDAATGIASAAPLPAALDYAIGAGPAASNLNVGDVASTQVTSGDEDDYLYGDGLQIGMTGDATNQVYRLYEATLGRAPDTAGHVVWTTQLFEQTAILTEVAGAFVNSREFQNVYGSLDDTAFVELLYQNVLGRASDETGLSGWLDVLAGTATRADVVVGFSESREFINSTAADSGAFTAANMSSAWVDDVYRLYQATLARVPDLGGLESWVDLLSQGTDYLDVVGGFTGSAEFQRAYGDRNDTDFIELLYTNVLGRGADAGGLAFWLDQLEGGDTREVVVAGFAQSREFVASTAAALAGWTRAQGTDDVLSGGGGDNVLIGGELSDTFVFDATLGGTHRVLDLEAWDALDFRSFGYDSAADVRANLVQDGANVIFADQGVSVVLENTLLGQITDDMIL